MYANGPITQLYVIYMTKLPSSQWVGRSAGDCIAHPYRRGLDAANWQLTGPLAARSTSFTVGVEAIQCGPLAGGGVVRPEVTYTLHTVVVTFFVKPDPPGAYTCPGRLPGVSYTVRLEQPLGNRTLLDGDDFPPTKPVTLTSLTP